MLAAKALNNYRNQLRKRDVTKYRQMIRQNLILSDKIKNNTPMDIQSISSANSQRSNPQQLNHFLANCQLSNSELSQWGFSECGSQQLQAIVKNFKMKTDFEQFSTQNIEQFSKLLYFISQCVISNKKKTQKLNCMHILYSFLPHLLKQFVQMQPQNTETSKSNIEVIYRVVSSTSILINLLAVKLQNQGLDQVQIQFLSFLIYEKIVFMKESSLLSSKKLINKSKSLLKMAVELVCLNDSEISEVILNNSMKTVYQSIFYEHLWTSQQEQYLFADFIQRSFELLQNKINSQIWIQNFLLLQKIIYNKAVLLFSINYEMSQFIFGQIILQAIQFQVEYSTQSTQFYNELVLKLMFQYCFQTKYTNSRWARYCKRVVQQGFRQERAGMLQGLALMMLYEIEDGKRELEILQIEMEDTQFFRLYRHLVYREVGELSKEEIMERIFADLVSQF